MDIRPATENDRETIVSLIRQYPHALIQDHVPEMGEFFVAEEEGVIVGCCALEIYSQRLAEVRSLAVAKEHQSKGIGTALVERCLQKAREEGVYEILTITSAVSFFEKQGFGTFKNEKFALIKVLGLSK